MGKPLHIENLRAELQERRLPSVTIWNRLEGRPRSVEFARSLRAEVRDPLWLLTRQWQTGEFHCDDAGSPVFAKLQLSEADVVGFQARGAPTVAIDGALPLEAVVERRSLSVFDAGGVGALDLRAVLGRRFLRLIPGVYRPAFIERYGFALPDPEDREDTEQVAHLEVWALLQTLAGRAMDGYRLYRYLTEASGRTPLTGIAVTDADKPAIVAAGEKLVAWFDSSFERPSDPSWDPAHLEHRFAVTAGVHDGEKRLLASEYPGGSLDWTAFSIDPDGARGSGKPAAPSMTIPTRTRFNGMPDTRWWALEDGRTNLGDVRADTTDIARLLFLEFALVYGNDWFTIPCGLPVGSLSKVEGLAVTNVFGERLWVEAAGRGVDDDWNRWSMFTLDIAGTATEPADTSLFVPATVPKSGEGPALEDVMLMRDEIANLVWGVERTVTLPTGRPKRGSEVAEEALAHRRRLALGGTDPVVADAAAPISYRTMTTVPENWIPFVAMHVPGDVRETQLQRAAMPRLLDGPAAGATELVRPRTSLLREGLDQPSPEPYYVFEEEVTRAGAQVSLAFQRTRWRQGRVVVWLSARRQTGRGEGTSGLAFDQILPTPSPEGP
jgi:hypothetical protein